MASKRKPFSIDHPIVLTFLIFAIIAFMYFTAEVLQPLAIALLLSLALAPLANFFERLRLPRAVSVVFAVILAVGALGAVLFVVGQQAYSLSNLVTQDKFRDRLRQKLEPFRLNRLVGGGTGIGTLVEDVVSDEPPTESPEGAEPIDDGDETQAPPPVAAASTATGVDDGLDLNPDEDVPKVQVVERPSFQERLETAVGPWLEFLAVASIVLILIIFLMINRNDLSDRVVQLVGANRLTMTTRTMEELGSRISRFLAILVAYNTVMGSLVGIAAYFLNVPYAATWGTIAALLRFIPYIGPVSAFLLPAAFSAAYFDGWSQAIILVAGFSAFEAFMTSFVEPIMYGKTTGISAVGLLVAIMFWTWLWGTVGLLLATPLTVCLAVLGKYVPQLNIFATLLGEDSAIDPDVRFYQRLIALDQDGADEVVEEMVKTRPVVEVYDTILVPALSRAERDRARDEIDDREQEFVWRVVGEVVDDLELDVHQGPSLDDATAPAVDETQPAAAPPQPGEVAALGIAANDRSDALVLRMLGQLLAHSGCPFEVVTAVDSPLALSEALEGREPRLILLSHLPPVGLTSARYLVKRLRSLEADLPILVGRWGEHGTKNAAERLQGAGASEVVFTLEDAKQAVLRAYGLASPAASPSPLLDPGSASKLPAETATVGGSKSKGKAKGKR